MSFSPASSTSSGDHSHLYSQHSPSINSHDAHSLSPPPPNMTGSPNHRTEGGSRSRGVMLGRGLACARCRKRKQKCDAAEPSCSNCAGAKAQCQYITPQPRPKPKQSMTAGEALTAKCERLQQRYESLLRKQSSSRATKGSRSRSTRLSTSSSTTSGASETEFAGISPGSTRVAHSPTPSHGSSAHEYFDQQHYPGGQRRSTHKSSSSSGGSTPTASQLPVPVPGSMPVHDPLIRALQVQDMSPADRDKVISIFFTGSQRLGCPLLPHRIFARLRDANPANHPHPALVNAMLLVGRAFTNWTPGYSTAEKHHLPANCPSEKDLLAKTQAYLNEALSHADRLLDYLQASILVSYYFFQTGRLQEGSVVSAANSRMAVMCKLNQIDPAVLDEMMAGNEPAPGQSMWDNSLLGRPADTYELGVRIWTFWQSWYYDAVFSLIGGTPLTRDPVTPTTVFPRPSSTYESGQALELQNTSFKELYENNPPQYPSPVNEPPGTSHPLATYLKGLALMEKANQMLGKVNAGLPLDDMDFSPATLQGLHASVQCLLTEHLPIRNEEMLSSTSLSKEAALRIYCPLAERVVGHVFIHTATIQLCRLSRALAVVSLPDQGKEALASIRLLELDAARGAVKALRLFGEEVRRLDARMKGVVEVVQPGASVVTEVQEHPCLLLGFLLTSVCMVLVDHIEVVKLSPMAYTLEESVAEISSAENDLKLCIDTIERTASSFRLLGIQAQKIKNYRDRSNRVVTAKSSARQAPRWEFEHRAALLDILELSGVDNNTNTTTTNNNINGGVDLYPTAAVLQHGFVASVNSIGIPI